MTLARVEHGPESLEFADAAGSLGALYRIQAKDLRARAANIRSKHGKLMESWSNGYEISSGP
jgi:hypothetical protein